MGKSKGFIKIISLIAFSFLMFSSTFIMADDKNSNTSLIPTKGEGNRLVVVEYSDFQCYYCAKVQPAVKKILDNYKDKIKLVFMQYPLTGIHPNALIAAKASLAAQKQGKFWELHDLMFKNQRNLSEKDLIKYAEKIGLDVELFKKDLKDKKIEAKVMADIAQGRKLGIRGTPTFFIGDTKIVGAVPYEKLSSVIEAKLKSLPKYKKKTGNDETK
ncbi:MAG: hypothetical protein D6734_05320 [Candidatus Schekmanbacteria bacterium]|nr:MAG: hypothetical protein D6734_05320 [Candidatus Schekmanbacteria bacterium]